MSQEQIDQVKTSSRPDVHRNVLIRHWVGLAAGLLLAILVYAILPDSLEDKGKATAAVGVLMAVWWMTEALPIAVTALVPLVAFPLLNVVEIGTTKDEKSDVGAVIEGAAAPYATDVIFMFMGGFMLALALQRWGLHKRLALRTALVVGTNPVQLIGGFMLVTGFITMWVSNTATAVMMLPLGLSVLTLVNEQTKQTKQTKQTEEGEEGEGDPNFGTALMLGIAYAASIGSVGTIIGTPPNTFLVGYLEDSHRIAIGFGQWMLFGVPLAVVFLLIGWVMLTRFIYPPKTKTLPGGREMIREQLDELGPMSRGEWTVLWVFVVAALSWIFIPTLAQVDAIASAVPWLERITDEVIAVLVALALFIIPVDPRKDIRALDWETARKLPWGVLLLFGGGLSLSKQIGASGLGTWIGEQISSIGKVPVILLLILISVVVLALTELASNTATAATFVPIIGAAAIGFGLEPMALALPVALVATLGFMLPAGTPPNAIAYGTGYVKIGQMVRAGIWFNIVGVILITIAMYTLAGWVFGISL